MGSRVDLKSQETRENLSQDCFSKWELVPAGVAQGTELGSWLFIIMVMIRPWLRLFQTKAEVLLRLMI